MFGCFFFFSSRKTIRICIADQRYLSNVMSIFEYQLSKSHRVILNERERWDNFVSSNLFVFLVSLSKSLTFFGFVCVFGKILSVNLIYSTFFFSIIYISSRCHTFFAPNQYINCHWLQFGLLFQCVWARGKHVNASQNLFSSIQLIFHLCTVSFET